MPHQLVSRPPACSAPSVFAQVLKPMQVEGVHWLFGAIQGGGGILADDPGLGKTLQVIAVLEALVAAGLAHRILVVTPSNLLGNWNAVRPAAPDPLARRARPARVKAWRLGRGCEAPRRRGSDRSRRSHLASQEFRKWLGGTPHELAVSTLKRTAAQLSIVDRLAQVCAGHARARRRMLPSPPSQGKMRCLLVRGVLRGRDEVE